MALGLETFRGQPCYHLDSRAKTALLRKHRRMNIQTAIFSESEDPRRYTKSKGDGDDQIDRILGTRRRLVRGKHAASPCLARGLTVQPVKVSIWCSGRPRQRAVAAIGTRGGQGYVSSRVVCSIPSLTARSCRRTGFSGRHTTSIEAIRPVRRRLSWSKACRETMLNLSDPQKRTRRGS